ncbi:MAG: VOC family protein [Kiritimatiellae bacterium]|nr:VOC family protein [Kiritimatiellia bacterium]
MIIQLAHTCFNTPDLDATLHFYRDILGLDVTFRFLRGEEPIGCYFHLGNQTFLECFTRKSGDYIAGDIKHFCLQTNDIDALEKTLQAADVPTRGNRMGSDHSKQLWCTDPNGIDIEFQEYSDKSCQKTGEDCHVDW